MKLFQIHIFSFLKSDDDKRLVQNRSIKVFRFSFFLVMSSLAPIEVRCNIISGQRGFVHHSISLKYFENWRPIETSYIFSAQANVTFVFVPLIVWEGCPGAIIIACYFEVWLILGLKRVKHEYMHKVKQCCNNNKKLHWDWWKWFHQFGYLIVVYSLWALQFALNLAKKCF